MNNQPANNALSRGAMQPRARAATLRNASALRPRVLFLAHRIPYPPDKGDKIRSFRWAAVLARRTELYLACFVDDRRDLRHLAALRRFCRDVIALPLPRIRQLGRAAVRWTRELLSPEQSPLTLAAYDDPRMHAAIRRWSRLADFDAVLAFSGAMAPYALRVPARRRVLDLCDCDSRKWADYAACGAVRSRLHPARWRVPLLEREHRTLRAAELDWLTKFDAVVVVNERERRLLRSPSSVTATVIRNGVDLPPIAPLPRAPVLGFIGLLDYAANIDGLQWFLRAAWPHIRARVPEARFLIVGRNAGRAVRRLARIDGVELIGAVAEVGPALATMRGVVIPLRIARGVQNKLLEALAHGRPVVATSAVAAGLDAATVPGVLIGDTSEALADAALRLLQWDGLAARLAADGRRFVETRFDWRAPCDALHDCVIGRTGAVRPPNVIRRRRSMPQDVRALLGEAAFVHQR